MAITFNTPVRFVPDQAGGGPQGSFAPDFVGPWFSGGNIYAALGDQDCITEPIGDLCGARNFYESTDGGVNWTLASNVFGDTGLNWAAGGGVNEEPPSQVVLNSKIYFVTDHGNDLYMNWWRPSDDTWDREIAGGFTPDLTGVTINNAAGPGFKFCIAVDPYIYVFYHAGNASTSYYALNYVKYDTGTDTWGSGINLVYDTDESCIISNVQLYGTDLHIFYYRTNNDTGTVPSGSVNQYLWYIQYDTTGDSISQHVQVSTENTVRGAFIYPVSQAAIGTVGEDTIVAISWYSNTLDTDNEILPSDPGTYYNVYKRLSYAVLNGTPSFTDVSIPYDWGDKDHFRWGQTWLTEDYAEPSMCTFIYDGNLYVISKSYRYNGDENDVIADDDYTVRLFLHLYDIDGDSWSTSVIYTEDDLWQFGVINFAVSGSDGGIIFTTSSLDAIVESPHSLNLRAYWAGFASTGDIIIDLEDAMNMQDAISLPATPGDTDTITETCHEIKVGSAFCADWKNYSEGSDPQIDSSYCTGYKSIAPDFCEPAT